MTISQSNIEEESVNAVLESIREIITDDIGPQISKKKPGRVRPKSKASSDRASSDNVLNLVSPIQGDEDILDLTDEFIATDPDLLISEKTAADSCQALDELKQLQTNEIKPTLDPSFGNQPLNQVTQDMLKPLLKQWLDAHLPSIVRSVVQEQIAKMMIESRS